MTIKILIADDHALLRQGVKRVLNFEDDLEVIGEAEDGQETLARTLVLQPDVLLLDLNMPGLSGLEVACQLQAAKSKTKIIVLTIHDSDNYVLELLKNGVLGYLLKDRVADIDTFLEAADRVAEGGLVLDPEVVAQVLGRGRKADPVAQLSPREREVLGLMAEGHTNAGIAKRLVVTEGAIEKHTQRIFSKLGLHPDPGVHRRVKAVLTLLSS